MDYLQAAHMFVSKKGSANFRMAVDLRLINSATVKEAWPIPHNDSEAKDFQGRTCFSQLEFVAGYWLLPAHQNSYHLCGIVTPNGVYSSKHLKL